MALRITLGIMAVTLLPLGLVFTIVGLTIDDVDGGSPDAVSGTFLAGPATMCRPGERVEITYDPAEAANFEPLAVHTGAV